MTQYTRHSFEAECEDDRMLQWADFVGEALAPGTNAAGDPDGIIDRTQQEVLEAWLLQEVGRTKTKQNGLRLVDLTTIDNLLGEYNLPKVPTFNLTEVFYGPTQLMTGLTLKASASYVFRDREIRLYFKLSGKPAFRLAIPFSIIKHHTLSPSTDHDSGVHLIEIELREGPLIEICENRKYFRVPELPNVVKPSRLVQ